MNAVSPFALLRVSLAAGVSLRAALCLGARGHCIDYLGSGCMVWLGSLWGDIAATAQSPCLCLACERSWVQFLLFPLQGSCVPSPCLWLFPASLGAASVWLFGGYGRFGGSVDWCLGGSQVRVLRWVRCFGGTVVQRFAGSVVCWFGGLAVWWLRMLRWFGGSVLWWCRWLGG